MTDVHYTQLREWLDGLQTPPAALWLIYGEESLREQAHTRLLEKLLPGGSRDPGYEPIYDDGAAMSTALEKVRTVSLLGDGKVVALLEARLFESAGDAQKWLKKIKTAVQQEASAKAGRFMARLLALKDLDYDALTDEDGFAAQLGLAPGEDHAWLLTALGYARAANIPIVKSQSGLQLLAESLERPFPEGNHLVLGLDSVDRRRKGYKAIAAKAVVVDCSVPTGSRAADKRAQTEVLRQRARELLSRHGKKMALPVFQRLVDKTGFQLRVFSSALETLIQYVGTRKEIEVGDVDAVLTRTRQDPVYTFTEALAQRHLQRSLFYLDSLLADQLNPLQVLAAMVNQVRRLIVARDFLSDPRGRNWRRGLPFNAFRQEVMSDVERYDKALADFIAGFQAAAVRSGKGKSKKGAKIRSDLFLAPNPKNAYPVYLLLQRAGRFTPVELQSILRHLHQADLSLKRTGRNPETVLTQMVFSICRPDAAAGLKQSEN